MTIDFEKSGIDYLLVNSTNEFLAEYSLLSENSRYTITNFSGSTGDALISKSGEVYLFVDGRYHAQAEQEINSDVTLVKLQTGLKQDEEIKKLIPEGMVLGIVGKKVSQTRLESFDGIKVSILSEDPVNSYTEINKNAVEFLPKEVTGKSFEEKIKDIPKPYFTSDCEEVSYLLNARDFSENYKSKIQAKLLLTEYESVLFTDMAVNTSISGLTVMPLAEASKMLLRFTYPVYVDKNNINVSDYSSIILPEVIESPVKKMKAIKTPEELNSYKQAFEATDKALLATRDFIMNNTASEAKIAEVLEENFRKFGAKGLSFKSIVAKDKNSALAHYSKCSEDELVGEGSLVLIDCGAYFENGLATDITRVFVKGQPSDEHKRIYTIVLKMFLNAFFSKADNGYETDAAARNLIKYNPIKGYSFGHGLGHGLGVNVHEAPPALNPSDIAKSRFEDGICFTIEPGLYNPEAFGIRLENSCYYEDGNVKSFTQMPYEEKLIDFSLLNDDETLWLKEFNLI